MPSINMGVKNKNFEDYEIRKISLDNIADIHCLFEKVFKIKMEQEFFRKKYSTKLFGAPIIGYIAYFQNQPVASYGIFPIILIDGQNKEYFAGQSGDTMTRPEFQKKGLFVHLAELTYSNAKEQGIEFIFGFPNNNSFNGFKSKLNWVFTGKLIEFNINILTFPFTELAYRFPIFRKIKDLRTYNVLKQYIVNPNDAICRKFFFKDNFIKVKKDIRFFEYKTYTKSYLIQINNFYMFIKNEGHLIIGDISYFKFEETDDFILTIKQLSKMLLSWKIKIHCSSNHWIYTHLSNKLKYRESNMIGFRNLSQFNSFERISFIGSDFDTF